VVEFSLVFLGEAISLKLIHRLRGHIEKKCAMYNIYAPAETTVVSICHLIDSVSLDTSIPLGRVLPNEQFKVLDMFFQPVVISQEGELFIGGAGVFGGYLARDDLTKKALMTIDDVVYYRSGDLVRIDHNGFIHYIGRKDFQIKLRGQRIELGEIERCLLDTLISACVVIKWSDDHLIAYVETSDIDEEELRHHCQSHLPPHMIPSMFIILEKLPLNANGKIDRKLLPPPDFSHLSSKHRGNDIELLTPRNEVEVTIHHIWCDIFRQHQISIDTNLFTIGGHSLLIMQLFHRYKIEFYLESNTLSIIDLFQHPTIADHAQLIHQIINITRNIDEYRWSSLNLTQGKNNFV
jgi:aryl carrier-like protein